MHSWFLYSSKEDTLKKVELGFLSFLNTLFGVYGALSLLSSLYLERTLSIQSMLTVNIFRKHFPAQEVYLN